MRFLGRSNVRQLNVFDLQNLEYVVVSGARRQENRWDPTENEQVTPDDKEMVKRLFDDPMFKLEHGSIDMNKAKKMAPVINKIIKINEANWKDDFSANANLRSQFRVGVNFIPIKFYLLHH